MRLTPQWPCWWTSDWPRKRMRPVASNKAVRCTVIRCAFRRWAIGSTRVIWSGPAMYQVLRGLIRVDAWASETTMPAHHTGYP